MAFELTILVFATLFYLLAWLPSSVAKHQAHGMKWLAGNRSTPKTQLPKWGERAERAHANLKDYYLGFCVFILMLALLDKFSTASAVFAASFFVLRLGHMVFYIAGWPLLRAISFILSMFCLIGLAVLCLL
jgi:uncharacterized MAPEG superfamily protein